MKYVSSAFTLIELLIVVAIIGILAAIAVPNFNNALMKARITRVQADMKNIATGIDMYQIDYNGYPIPGTPQGELIDLGSSKTHWTATKVSPRLTTPTPYMSMIPHDIFNPHKEETVRRYNYISKEYADMITDPLSFSGEEMEAFDYFIRIHYKSGLAAYFLHSYGPDKDGDAAEIDSSPNRAIAMYNPTNGIYSSGDIIHFSAGASTPESMSRQSGSQQPGDGRGGR